MPSRNELQVLARLRLREAEALYQAGLKRAVGLASPRVANNWSLAQPWRPERRYNPPGSTSINEAKAMLDAIRHPEYGVLRWIAKRW